MADARLKDQMVTRRTTLLASLSRAEQFVTQYDAERDGLEVQIRLDNLDQLWASLEETQTALEDLEDMKEGKMLNLQYRASMEPRLFRVKAQLKAKLPTSVNPNGNRPLPDNPPRSSSTLSGLRLPRISLPDFNGDYKQWLTFYDTFLALIHENVELPPIQKFHYLRAAVKGEAAQIIETISISAANYPIAWQTLVTRYSNEYLLKKRHLQDLLEIPRMKKETASALHSTVDEFQRHVKILEQLGEPTAQWSTLLEHLLCIRLHDDTIQAWEDHAETVKNQTYKCLVEFLEKRIRVLESVSVNHNHVSLPSTPATGVASTHNRKPSLPFKVTTHAVTQSPATKCHACEQNHPLVKCSTFEKMTLAERLRIVNSKRLCLNCFRHDHFARECSSSYSCRVCKKRHHSLLHPGYVTQSNKTGKEPNSATNSSSPPQQTSSVQSRISVQGNPDAPEPETVQCNSTFHNPHPTVFMLTVVLRIVDVYGKEHFARALLDSASQPNLMSDRLAQLLRLRRQKANVLIHGIGEKPEHATDSVSTKILSRKNNFARDVNFLVLKRMISKLPAEDVAIDSWNLPDDVFLADPGFNRSSEIDLVIGTQFFFDCFPTASKIHLSDNLPEMVNSVFGWIIAGGSHLVPSAKETVSCTTTAQSLVPLEESMERFWKIEELPSRCDWSPEEKACEELYKSTTIRDNNGRYIVSLPKQHSFAEMVGESKSIALRRFHLLERRLSSDPALKESYDKFMAEYVALGHMRAVPDDSASEAHVYYLPHHPVVKESSTTTKTRVVFDGSSKTSSGYSLNHSLRVGPVVQDDLLTLILRFRKYPVAMVADIEKMYRQVQVHSTDTPLQRILWRFSPTDPLLTYELQTVTYGLAPSSFLATRTLRQLADDDGDIYPLGASALRNSFYVDDYIGGADSISEAIQLRNELTELLERGGLPLRKWTSNKLEVLQGLSADQIGTQSVHKFDPDETVKTLGILWEPESDQFRFDLQVKCDTTRVTKRAILSAVSQLFDPLGLIAPVVVKGKMMMQELWLAACSWDSEVSESIRKKWEKFYDELPGLSEFRIDRYAFRPNSTIQLHSFADASEAAYGACTYARTEDSKGNVHIQLLAAKSRISPLKRQTLPRLELCAALIATQLHSRIVEALQIGAIESFYWSDSTVVLQWLRTPPSSLKTFVANRVSEIQTSTHGSHWRHVSGTQNPADLVSRGMHVSDFLTSSLWKKGPEWLAWPETDWPTPKITISPEAESECKQVVTLATTTSPVYNPVFTLYRNFSRLVRITAYCQRFINNLRTKARTEPANSSDSRPSKALTADQISQAKAKLVQMAQADCFQDEIYDLQQGRLLKKTSPIRLLNPFVDSEGTLRVGGRLKLSEQPYLSKHPALLPSFHPLAKLIAKNIHYKLVHGGGHVTLSTMREEYWPLQGRRLVRSVIRHCFQCARANPVPVQQQIGQLPAQRITVSKPFAVTGVDYAGPVYLKPIHKRAPSTKAYICLFVCFTTKAVHLELVSDLSTVAFLKAFRRFVSRRGQPAHLHSDNGKNFVGAKNELHQIYQMLYSQQEVEKIQQVCAEEEIVWHLNPPKAPHFGGLWEAAVKVAKTHLYCHLGNTLLSFEDLSTVLAEIEAAMNSRPLVPMTEDPNDFSALTPAHFIIGSTMHSVPSPNVCDIPRSRLDHYHQLQQLYQQFWHHWRTEYLQELQKDTRSRQPNTAISPGRLVVIVDEFQHPVRWPLARIEAVHPGADGLVRVVSLRTPKGIIKRPVTKICLLPIESEYVNGQ